MFPILSMTRKVLVPAVEVINGRRVVAAPAAIDSGRFPSNALLLRIAPDDILVIGDGSIELADDAAIIEADAGWCALRVSEEQAKEIIAHHAAWNPPSHRPVMIQGMIAGLPAKVYLDGDDSLIMVATPFAAELEARLA